MKHSSHSDGLPLPLSGLILFLIASPMLLQGYGSDWDAWGVVQSAEMMWQSHSYVPSRLPGFPLYELFVTPFVVLFGWVASNLISLACLFGILLILNALARDGHFRYARLALIAIVFLPIMVRDATSTMDYIPGLLLLMMAYLKMMRGQPLHAALWIGVAAGVRVSLLAFLLPLLVYCWLRGDGFKKVVVISGIGIGIGVVSFSPALFHTGVPASLINQMDGVTRFFYAGYNAMDLFGLPGWLVLLGVVGWWVSRREQRIQLNDPFIAFHLVNIIIWSVIFLLMPHEADYLLPLVPSIFFLLDRLVSRRSMIIVVVVLMSNHLVTLDPVAGLSGYRRPGLSIEPGLTLGDYLERRHSLSYREAVNQGIPDQPTLLMYCWYYGVVDRPGWKLVGESWNMYKREDGLLMLSDRVLDIRTLRFLKKQGWRLVVWRHRKGEYIHHGPTGWEKVVEIVPDLGEVLNYPVTGMPRQ